MDQRKTALIFKAFCDENRVRILNLLRGGEKCACRLLEEMSISQPTLSHHMRILCDSALLWAGRRASGCTTASVRRAFSSRRNTWMG